jgi:hypothetical protein
VSTQSKYERPEYPALYNAANQASIDSQKYYMLGFKWYLFLTILAALLSIYIKESREAGIIATIVFLGVLFLTIYQAYKRFDKDWYNGRSVAESVKTRTWRFIMRAEPYLDASDLKEVKKSFCKDLNDILDQNRELGTSFTHPSMTEETITDSMLDIRKRSYEDRLNYYISNRINEQRAWYFTKASLNKKLAKKWFTALVVTQSVVIISLLVEIGYEIYYLPTAAIIVAGSSILSWMQIRRYQDLATSYSLTAHEIGILKSQSFVVNNEATLSDFIKDAENAFSREHTQWVARKDQP